MKISIIIPIYNVESYFRNCIDSVLSQTYSDCELIFVNDRTPDQSMKILQEYISSGKIEFTYKIINHEKNRGLSAARNSGIDAATGDYLFFLDSDDKIPPNSLEILGSYVYKYHPDFVIGNIHGEGFNDTSLFNIRIDEEFLNSNTEILTSFTQFRWYMMAQNKLINRSFVLTNRLYFKEGIVSEDELWSFQLAICAKTMAVCHEDTYNYYKRGGSITSSISLKRLKGYLQTILFVKEYISENSNCNDLWNFYRRKLYTYSCLIAFSNVSSQEKKMLFIEMQSMAKGFVDKKNNSLIDIIRLPIYYMPYKVTMLYTKFLYSHLQRWKFI